MLNYFGESTVWTTCDNCSSCKGSGDKVNVTKEAKAIFRAIMGTDERYGASMITSIVRGERTDPYYARQATMHSCIWFTK